MFDQWLDTHQEAILKALIAWRRSQNDTRPDDFIRTGAEIALKLLGQSLRGEVNWEEASRVGTEQGLARGIPLPALAESSYGIYKAISQVLRDERPEHWAEWLDTLGDHMLLAGQVVTQVLEAKLEELVLQRTQEMTLFKTMADNSTDAIVMTNPETHHFTYANRAAHEMYGYDYDRQELVGMALAYKVWCEEDIPFLTETISPQIMAGGWKGEVRQKRKDGAIFEASDAIFPLHDNTGKLVGIAGMIRDITERKQAEAERERLQQEIIEAQQRAIAELSTPVIPIMDRIIVMPLIGSIDSLRARDITRSLLAGISQYRAKVVILDVTGVSLMDTGIVNHLNKTIQAARLKGARTILTGLSDAVAESVVDLGIDWSGLTTLSDLQTGLLAALDSLGVRLTR